MASKKVYQVGDEPTFSKVDKVYVVNQTEGGGGVADEVAWENVTDKPSSFPPTEHNHDDRYYTKAEIDTKEFPTYKPDEDTIVVENGELKARTLDGLTIGVADGNTWLAGADGNIPRQIDDIDDSLTAITSGMHYLGKCEVYADLMAITSMDNGDLAVVLADENRSGGRSMYVYREDIGAWEFIGEFTFSDEFTALKDTPTNYEGADGKVVKVAGEHLTSDDVTYADIADNPTSTVAQSDEAVSDRHRHENKANIDEIGESGEGVLTYKGEEYVKKADFITPQKKTLSAFTNKEDRINKGNFLKFHETRSGSDIPYDPTTGIFDLEIGKKYEITVNLQTEVGGFLIFRVSKADKSDFFFPAAVMYGARSSAVYGGSGTLNLIIQPTEETGNSFAIQTSPDSSDDYTTTMRYRCSLVIKEL